METLTLSLLLLLGINNNETKVTTIHRWGIAQDTTSAKVWRQRAEAAAEEARRQKRIAERMAEQTMELKKKLEECQGKIKK